MKIVLVITALVLTGCTSKFIAKNCDQTKSEAFWVCDKVK